MEESISAAEASRQFARILREVRCGTSYVVTRHGKPVARIVAAAANALSASGGRDALLARLEAQPVMDVGRWTREETCTENP